MAEKSRKKRSFERSIIAIIAILAGMLLPALNRARERARNVDCMGKQRQLAQGLQQYLPDYKETHPAGRASTDWIHLLVPYLYPKASGMTVLQIQMKIVTPQTTKASSLFHCPSMKQFRANAAEFSLGYNTCLFGDQDYYARSHSPAVKRPIKLVDLKRPTQQMYFADSRSPNYIERGRNYIDDKMGFALRHDKKLNMAMADGHVETRDRRRTIDLKPHALPLNCYLQVNEVQEYCTGYVYY